jgi:hypothetical protein
MAVLPEFEEVFRAVQRTLRQGDLLKREGIQIKAHAGVTETEWTV